MSDIFISCRRSHLDAQLERIRAELSGDVLDVGGRRNSRRGSFIPPHESVRSWTIINPDKSADPDIRGALPELPLPNGSFDQILCTEVLEYVDAPAQAIHEMSRVLTSNGTLYISVPFLHVLHGDAEIDLLRFTVTYIRDLVSANFHSVNVYPMGGFSSVVFDLAWHRLKKYSLLRLIFQAIGPYLVRNDRPSFDVTTGFFVVARVPKRTQRPK
jgi:SAM-dependent methyltransferase